MAGRSLSVSLLLCLFACAALAAEPILSAKDGQWHDGATWTGGKAPASGDRAVIRHKVTVSKNADLGHSPSKDTQQPAVLIEGKGSLTLGDGATLVCRGHLWSHGRIEMKAGSVLSLNSEKAAAKTHYLLALSAKGNSDTVLKVRGSKKRSATVASNPLNCASIVDGHKEQKQKNGTVYLFPTKGGGRIDAEFARFVGLGSETRVAWQYSQKDGMEITLKDCVFEKCGKTLPRSSYAKVKLVFERCRWVNSVPMTKRDRGAGSGVFRTAAGKGSECRLTSCDFDEIVSLSKCNGFTIEDCIFRQGVYRFGGKWNEGDMASFRRNLLRWPEKYCGGGIRLPYGETYEDCFFIQDYQKHNNPHYMSARGKTGTAKLQGCLFWFSGPNNVTFGPEGDGPMPGKADSGTVEENNLIIERCIFMPNGNGPDKARNLSANITSGVFPTTNAQVIVRRNTAYAGGGPGGVCIGETHATVKGALTYVKSNLFVGSPKNDGQKMHDFGKGVEGAVKAEDCDYNAGYRLKNGSNYIAGTAGKGYSKLKLAGDKAIGKHDLDDVDPQFVDASRSPLTWCKSIGGDGTMMGAMDQLRPTGAHTIQELLDYVRQGFRPRNRKLKGAGDPAAGSPDIGAVDLK